MLRMKQGCLKIASASVHYALMTDLSGCWRQLWYAITPHTAGAAMQQLQQLAVIEQAELALFNALENEAREAADNVAARRFFVADLSALRPALADFKARQRQDFFLSQIQQPPACGAHLSLLGLCVKGMRARRRRDGCFSFHTAPGVQHLFVEQLIDAHHDAASSAETQTAQVLQSLQNKLASHGGSLADHVLRTWIYAPDIDSDYAGIIKARRQCFDQIGLNQDTHYIASTGIQGSSAQPGKRVSLEAYAQLGKGVHEAQHIRTPAQQCPAHWYGASFERASRVRNSDTDTLLISGTASIDHRGEVVHVGDVEAQTRRTLENIDALLAAAAFSRHDLSYFIVYLREASAHTQVRPLITAFAPYLPVIFVHAPVCRPAWLVEIEAAASRIGEC